MMGRAEIGFTRATPSMSVPLTTKTQDNQNRIPSSENLLAVLFVKESRSYRRTATKATTHQAGLCLIIKC